MNHFLMLALFVSFSFADNFVSFSDPSYGVSEEKKSELDKRLLELKKQDNSKVGYMVDFKEQKIKNSKKID